MPQSDLVAALAALPGVPGDLLAVLAAAATESGMVHCALVGGSVRDLLLHRAGVVPWSGVPDFDVVVEGDLPRLVDQLQQRLGPERLTRCAWHNSFGTVALTVDGISLDLAMAREESYPAPAMNPQVRPGTLASDLVRRDFSINAMALDLISGALIDPHGGQAALQARRLAFLHDGSVSDDPTRVIRAARYGARLNLHLAEDSRDQLARALGLWPWPRPCHGAAEAPALSTRLRMELDRLFLNEPWSDALEHLSRWQAMALIDPGLQVDSHRQRRLHRAQRFGLPLMVAWLAAASRPQVAAKQLQIPGQQQQWLVALERLQQWLDDSAPPPSAPPSQWTAALEDGGWPVQAVELLICLNHQRWRPLWRWWSRWRHVQSPRSAKTLIAEGFAPGPGLGAELRRQRFCQLDQG